MSKAPSKAMKATIAVAIVIVFIAGYAFIISPWLLTSGATKDELSKVLPGDKYLLNPKIRMTQAITINAPPQKVWSWLVQMGQDRAGFYSYERLERLLGFGIHNTYRIVPEWQKLKAGDFVKFHQNGIGMQVVSVEKEKNILLLTDYRKPMKPAPEKKELIVPLPGSMYIIWDWDFNLYPLPGNKTRLIARAYADWNYSNPALQGLLNFMVGLPSSIMQKQMLKEIKQCAEGNHPSL